MPRTHLLERRQLLPLPLADVFPFFAQAENLEAITPDSLCFHIHSPRPIVIQPGTLIDYSIRLFGVPMRWQTRIEEFDPPHRFVDVQLRGPYRSWRHTHEFHVLPHGTEVIDRVEYQMPLGPLGTLAHVLFVRRTLNHIFDFRRERIERLLISDRAATHVAAAPSR